MSWLREGKFVDLIPIWYVPLLLKASTLLKLHAPSGADITGSFINKGKLTRWKTLTNNPINDVLDALTKGSRFSLAEEIRQRLEELVRQRCAPKTALRDLEEGK